MNPLLEVPGLLRSLKPLMILKFPHSPPLSTPRVPFRKPIDPLRLLRPLGSLKSPRDPLDSWTLKIPNPYDP